MFASALDTSDLDSEEMTAVIDGLPAGSCLMCHPVPDLLDWDFYPGTEPTSQQRGLRYTPTLAFSGMPSVRPEPGAGKRPPDSDLGP